MEIADIFHETKTAEHLPACPLFLARRATIWKIVQIARFCITTYRDYFAVPEAALWCDNTNRFLFLWIFAIRSRTEISRNNIIIWHRHVYVHNTTKSRLLSTFFQYYSDHLYLDQCYCSIKQHTLFCCLGKRFMGKSFKRFWGNDFWENFGSI